MAQKLPDVFSTHSAAKFCRVTPMTIIRWIDEGRIKAYKTPGGHRRIMRADLEAFCRDNQIPMQWEDRVDAGTQRVLIVDDDPTVVDSILDAIFDDEDADADTAYKVEHTNNAFEAGRQVATFRPHILFLDVGLPGIDPPAVARLVHQDPATSHTRVIAVAADGSVEKVGFDDVLQHPIAKRAVLRITGPLPSIMGK